MTSTSPGTILGTNVVAGLMLKLLAILLVVCLIVFIFGLIVGPFTYGQTLRRNRRKNSVVLDDVFDLGKAVSHALLDVIFKRKPTGNSSWLDDRQLIAMLRGMEPNEFEEFIAKMFIKRGYRTELVGGSNDGGVDIAMVKDGRHYIVQCKKYIKRKVNPHDIRDFYGAMGGLHIDGKGFFITTNIFTSQAESFAEDKPIELIDGTRLIEMVRESRVLGVG